MMIQIGPGQYVNANHVVALLNRPNADGTQVVTKSGTFLSKEPAKELVQRINALHF